MKRRISPARERRPAGAKRAALAGMAGLAVMLGLTLLEAVLADKLILGLDKAAAGAWGVWGLSGFAAGFLGGEKNGNGGLLPCILAGVCMAGGVWLLSAILCKADLSNAAAGTGIILGGSAFGGLLRLLAHPAAKKKYRVRS